MSLKLRGRWRCEHCGALLTYSERWRVILCVGCWLVFIGLVICPPTRPWAMRLAWSIPTTLVVMFALVAWFDRLIVLESRGARCRQCGYDLAGLEERRCPECGTSY